MHIPYLKQSTEMIGDFLFAMSYNLVPFPDAIMTTRQLFPFTSEVLSLPGQT